MAAEKIRECHVNIQVENKEGGTIQFTVTTDSRTRANNITQHIQGEFCDVSIFIIHVQYFSQGHSFETELKLWYTRYAPYSIPLYKWYQGLTCTNPWQYIIIYRHH